MNKGGIGKANLIVKLVHSEVETSYLLIIIKVINCLFVKNM